MGSSRERETEDLSSVSWNWIKTGELKKETEGLIFAVQDQALRTNAIKAKCRVCGSHDETVQHINFYVVAPSLRRRNMKGDMMVLGGSYIGSCARNMVFSAVTNGTSIPPKAYKRMRK